MATSNKKKKKGRKVGKVVAYEMTIAARGKNGHGVILKSENMEDPNFLDLDAPESSEADLAAALDSAPEATTKAHGDDGEVTSSDVQGASDLGGAAGESAEEVLADDLTAPEKTPAPAPAPVAASTEPPAPAQEVAPEPAPETPAAPAANDEPSPEEIGAQVLSFAMGLADASEDTSDAVAIAKAVGSLEFLASEKVITRLKAGDLPLVVRKSAAAALGQAILQLQGVKGSEEVTEMAGNATALFKSLRVPAPAKATGPATPAQRLKNLRKSLGSLAPDIVGVPTPRPAAPAAQPRSVPAESASRTEPQPAAHQDEGGDEYLEDIND